MSNGRRRSSIQPVWEMGDRNWSSDVLDTAETLLENIDQLADVLDNLDEKYNIEMERLTSEDLAEVGIVVTDPLGNVRDPREKRNSTSSLGMFRSLKSCLDSTRHLIQTLRKEKSQLMKRELSMECKLGEIEDYKNHVKQDLTSLNEMVDLLTTKVFTLESQLCDEQEKYDSLKFERDDHENRHVLAQKLLKDVEDNYNRLSLRNKELRFQNEVLVAENAKLKEMLRELTEGSKRETCMKTSITVRKGRSYPELPDPAGTNNLLINEETATSRL